MRRFFLLVCLAVVVWLGTACGGGDNKPILGGGTATPVPNIQVTPPPATSAPSTPVVTGGPTGGAPTDLSLVYVDARAGTNSLFVARYDGQSPRAVGTLPSGARPLEMRGSTLLAANGAALLVVDLKTGDTKTVNTEGAVRDGRFLDDATFLYSTAGGCGGGPAGLPQLSRLWRLDMKTLMTRQLATGQGNAISIVGIDPAAQRVAIVKRGCDPGIGDFYVLEAGNGAETSHVNAMGCGNAVVAIPAKVALLSWAACGFAINKPGVSLQVYNYAGATPQAQDIRAPDGGSVNNSTLLPRPNGLQVALGTQEVLTTPRAGGPRSTGLWVLDLASGAFSATVPADGAEQYPVTWSPDGRYLLYSTVQAQGVCTTAFIDTVSKAITKVDDKITGCGVNGTMVGWTRLG